MARQETFEETIAEIKKLIRIIQKQQQRWKEEDRKKRAARRRKPSEGAK